MKHKYADVNICPESMNIHNIIDINLFTNRWLETTKNGQN